MQLDLESGTICRWISDSRTRHTAVSDSRQKTFYFVTGTKAQCESPPPTFNLRFRYPLTHLLTHGQTGSPNRPWQPGPISSGVTKNSEPLYTIYPYPRRALFPKPCSPQTSSSVPLATSTFDVAVHLAIGPTGPPDNCKVARRSSPVHPWAPPPM